MRISTSDNGELNSTQLRKQFEKLIFTSKFHPKAGKLQSEPWIRRTSKIKQIVYHEQFCEIGSERKMPDILF